MSRLLTALAAALLLLLPAPPVASVASAAASGYRVGAGTGDLTAGVAEVGMLG